MEEEREGRQGEGEKGRREGAGRGRGREGEAGVEKRGEWGGRSESIYGAGIY